MTNARRSIFSGLMILAAGAAVITSLLLITPSTSIEGQAAAGANALPARDLGSLALPTRVENCSRTIEVNGSDVAQPECTNAELVVFHPLSEIAAGDRTDEDDPGFDFTGANADNFTYRVRPVGAAPATSPPVSRNLDLVAASGTLYAAVRNQVQDVDNNDEISPRNIIRYGADVIGIAVYDQDASSRQSIMVSETAKGSSTIVTAGISADISGIGASGNITLTVPFDHRATSGTPSLPILDANGDGTINQGDFTVTAENAGTNTAVPAADLASNIFVSVTSPGNPDTRGNALFTITSTLTYNIDEVTISWTTAGASNTVPVQVATGATSSSQRLFLELKEVQRGSSVFVGEVQLVPSGVQNYRVRYNTQRGLDVTGTAHTTTSRVVSTTSSERARIVGDELDNSAVRAIIPSRPSDTLRVTYRDKIGVTDEDPPSNDFRSISQAVSVDSIAPSITITGPADGSATNLRRPTFSGTASDQTGGSGLDVSELRLFVPDEASLAANNEVLGYSLFEGDGGTTRVYFEAGAQFNATSRSVETAGSTYIFADATTAPDVEPNNSGMLVWDLNGMDNPADPRTTDPQTQGTLDHTPRVAVAAVMANPNANPPVMAADAIPATPVGPSTFADMSRSGAAYDSGNLPLINSDGYFRFGPFETATAALVDKNSLFPVPNPDETLRPTVPFVTEDQDDVVIGRLLGGSEDDNTGLYSRGYNDGATVSWSYTPGEGGNLLNSISNSDLDAMLQYQVFAFDVAGNVGLVDVDPENDKGVTDSILEDFDNPSFNLDSKVPSLADGARNAEYTNSDVQWNSGIQTGVNWDSSSGDLVVSRNHIAVTFDDEISLPPASAFTITWDDATFGGTITNVVAGPSDVEVADLDEPPTGETARLGLDLRTSIVEDLSRTVFLEISADIPSSETPRVVVAGVQDTAGNTIEANAEATIADIQDGLGPAVTVALNGGSGTGVEDSAQGPGMLTNSQINIVISTNESANEPVVTITDANGMPTTDRLIPFSEGQNAQGGDNYRIQFTRRSGEMDGDRCVQVTVEDNSSNPTSVGAKGDFVTGSDTQTRKCRDTDGAIFFTVDATAPAVDPNRTERQEVFSQTPRVQLILSEEVQRDTVELWVNNEKVDDTVLASNLSSANNRDFVYQVPAADTLRFGLSTIHIRATDVAGNRSGMLPVTVRVNQPGELELSLNRGWNLISFPSAPIVAGVGDVFDDDAIQSVSTFDAANFRAGEQTANRNAITGNFAGDLSTIKAGLAYWVFADSVASLEVILEGPSAPSENAVPAATTIRTIPGYNLVGIVDNARQRTQGIANSTFYLQRGGNDVTVDSYFVNVPTQRILRYDSAASRFVDVDRNVTTEFVRIGEGLLVFIQQLPNGSTPTITP